MEILEQIYAYLPLILTAALGVFALKTQRAISVLKEMGELLVKVAQAVGDSKITEEEIAEIKKEAMDVYAAVKGKTV